MNKRNGPLIEVLLNGIQRERERIERARSEIIHLKEELADLGWEPPDKGFWNDDFCQQAIPANGFRKCTKCGGVDERVICQACGSHL